MHFFNCPTFSDCSVFGSIDNCFGSGLKKSLCVSQKLEKQVRPVPDGGKREFHEKEHLYTCTVQAILLLEEINKYYFHLHGKNDACMQI